ncbi:MAG: hypothetical protein AAGC80_25950 [Rhodococcus sp. (in: high G+C Gram-positive bacteria)]
MTERTDSQRTFIVEGHPWKDAVIAYLEPRSPYWPWFISEPVRSGDVLITILDTEPPTTLCMELVGVASPGTIGVTQSWALAGLPSVAAVEASAGVVLPTTAGRVGNEVANRVFDLLLEHRVDFDDSFPRLDEASHTTAASARVLLKSAGKCTACGNSIDLRGSAARDRVHIHTAENGVERWSHYGPAHDWPAALCTSCQTAMTEGGFSSFLDYRFSFHPRCPRCAASQTRCTSLGMPIPGETVPPWTVPLGCIFTDPVPDWICGVCGHRWAN